MDPGNGKVLSVESGLMVCGKDALLNGNDGSRMIIGMMGSPGMMADGTGMMELGMIGHGMGMMGSPGMMGS